MVFSDPFDFVSYLMEMDIETLKFIYPNIYSHNDIFKRYTYDEALEKLISGILRSSIMCPIGLAECKYPDTCFKPCDTCKRKQIEDEINMIKLDAVKEAVEEYRDKLVNIMKEWYWDDKMQSYHPDCDLFVNKFIVTVKEEVEKMFKD